MYGKGGGGGGFLSPGIFILRNMYMLCVVTSFLTKNITLQNMFILHEFSYQKITSKNMFTLRVANGLHEFSHQEYSFYGIRIRCVWSQGQEFAVYSFKECVYRVLTGGRICQYILFGAFYTGCSHRGKISPDIPLWNMYTPCCYRGDNSPGRSL